MQQNTIHKVHITPEAVFDYEECMELGQLDKYTLKAEIENYINYMTESGRLIYENYFRCNIYNDSSDETLILFIYRDKMFGIMQIWRLEGICKAINYSGHLEDFGTIRMWLKIKTESLVDESDWVIELRTNKIIKNTDIEFLENVKSEVRNAFECERDKEIAEKLLCLQSVYFRRKRRKSIKKKA